VGNLPYGQVELSLAGFSSTKTVLKQMVPNIPKFHPFIHEMREKRRRREKYMFTLVVLTTPCRSKVGFKPAPNVVYLQKNKTTLLFY
jgi:hypothetical protein